MKRFLPLLLCLLALQALLPPAPVEALTVTGLEVTLTCTGGHANDFSYTFDRDNTGLGKEAFQIVVTDSDSHVVHLVSNSVDLGPYSEGGSDFSYNMGTAVAGAITYQWVSQAGNGYDEQVAYSYIGFCGDAPTSTPTATPTPTSTPTPTATATETPTPTDTPTPGPSPTATPSITPTANYIVRATVVTGDTYQDVALVYQISAGDIAIVLMLAAIFGVLVVGVFLNFRRGA